MIKFKMKKTSFDSVKFYELISYFQKKYLLSVFGECDNIVVIAEKKRHN